MDIASYKRVVLKLSGESLAGDQGFGIDLPTVDAIAAEVKKVREHGIDVAVVVGGGNIWRGLAGSDKGMDRAQADYMGMLATVMNSLALQSSLENIDVDTRVQSAIEMRQIAEPYIRRKAVRHLEKGRVVILQAREIRTSRRIRPRLFALLRSRRTSSSWRRRASTASTILTRVRIRRQRSSVALHTWRF